MKENDIVVPINGFILRSGSCTYENAIVASAAPFRLVSLEGDMVWSATVTAKDFKVAREATTEEILCVSKHLLVNKEVKDKKEIEEKRKMMVSNKPSILCKDPIF